MAITINGVVCQEIVRDFGEEFDIQGGPRAIKGFYCAWTDRYRVVVGLLGLSTTVSVGGVITLEEPSAYPELSTIFCGNVRVEPKGPPIQSSPQIAFSNCIVWAEYRTFPWTFSGFDFMQIDPATPFIYARQNIDMAMQQYEVPGRMLYYYVGGLPKPSGQSWSFPCPIITLEITLIRIPYLPAPAIIQAATNGPLNDGVFLGCADGTVMFNGFRNQQSWDSAGNFTQDATYSFAYRPVAPWDFAFYGPTGVWAQLKTFSGNPIMQRTNLNVLFPGYYNA